MTNVEIFRPWVVSASVAATAVAVFALPRDAHAQLPTSSPVDDVVRLGQAYGTRPPDAYFEHRAIRPDAFEFRRAWKRRNPSLRQVGFDADGRPDFAVVGGPEGGDPTVPFVLGPRGKIEGTLTVPVVLGYFADDPGVPEFSDSDLEREFFTGPNSRFATITEYYDEVSGGRLTLTGAVQPWVQASLTRFQVTGGNSGLGASARVGEFIAQLLIANIALDWGPFDNDGPDGIPNSGDDDGVVDVLAVIHPTHGGECGDDDRDNRIWSHRWSLQESIGQSFATATPSANGGMIRVDDYTIQPMRACSAGHPINGIGVFAHELGHGLGLPDLYDTSLRHEGVGEWGLMGSGAWGCVFSPLAVRPCHMGAWAKEQLGWVDVVTLPPRSDAVLTIPPVETSGQVFRVDAQDGSGEYFLLENRQAIGFDEVLGARSTGLLIWHVDPGHLLDRWPDNVVNLGARQGVAVEQADGLQDLVDVTGGNRGDEGDPFPGATGQTAFHAGSFPGSATNAGGASGLTVLDIAEVGEDVVARVVTGPKLLTVVATGSGAPGARVGANGMLEPESFLLESPPFVEHTIHAGPGGDLAPGVRSTFERWVDGATDRDRDYVMGLEDRTLTAIYLDDVREVRVRVMPEGGVEGVAPGSVRFDPPAYVEGSDHWMIEGTNALVIAEPTRGFAFSEWSGALAGQANPAPLLVEGPTESTVSFDLIFGIPEARDEPVQGARPFFIQLVAENGTPPVRWSRVSGELPDGVTFSESGILAGTPRQLGSFPIGLRAEDARGLPSTGTVTLDISLPLFSPEVLTGPFLGGAAAPSVEEAQLLDDLGNENGGYDLGDLRAFVLENPGALVDGDAVVVHRASVRLGGRF